MKIKKLFKKNEIIVKMALVLVLAGCAKNNSQTVELASQNITQSLGCTDLKSLMFDSFYDLVESEQSIPSVDSLKNSLKIQIEQLKKTKNLSDSESVKLDQIYQELIQVVDIMINQSLQQISQPGGSADQSQLSDLLWKELVRKMIEYEMEDQSTPEIIAAHTRLNQSFRQIKKLSSDLPLNCENSFKASSQLAAQAVVGFVPLTLGTNRIFATAYQSCHVLDLPVMDKNSESVVGIAVTGKHSDGVGNKRVISDLKSVQKTHYYVKNSTTEVNCTNPKTTPLIYDYGGEPSVSGNNLNFFKDAGTGTKALGIDCSSFVSSAVAVSGYRYKPNLPNKTIFTRQTSSKFINAATSGFTCFENVTLSPKSSVAAGDIVGIKGHVVIIDRVGADPFGLLAIKKETDCGSLNYKNFDMDVAQSSPSKGAIGLNKFALKDYLDETIKMRTAFVEMGKQACLAKFQNKSIKPLNTEWGFMRHKGTTECLASRVTLTGETCAQKCFN